MRRPQLLLQSIPPQLAALLLLPQPLRTPGPLRPGHKGALAVGGCGAWVVAMTHSTGHSATAAALTAFHQDVIRTEVSNATRLTSAMDDLARSVREIPPALPAVVHVAAPNVTVPVTVAPSPAPAVTVGAPVVHVAAPEVNVTVERPAKMVGVERDAEGRIVRPVYADK